MDWRLIHKNLKLWNSSRKTKGEKKLLNNTFVYNNKITSNNDYIKLIDLCAAKEMINMKGNLRNEKIFSNYIFDRALYPKYIRNSFNSTVKTQWPNPNKKWAKDPNKHFSKEDVQMASGYMTRCSTSLTREMQKSNPPHFCQNGQYQPLLGANAADDFQLKNAQTTAQLHPSHTLVK